MRLNSLKPAAGSRPGKKRVGRGIGSGLGKTCGRGHKGQHARAGGFHKVGFEGGQMPMQRRLPKIGFRPASAPSRAEVRLADLARVADEVIDLQALKRGGFIPARAPSAKVIVSGKLEKAVRVRGLGLSRGARAAITAAGGSIEE